MALLKPSKRSSRIKPFLAMEVMERAGEMRRAGEDVISLSLGEPDFPPPACVKKACMEALEEDFTKYTHSLGMIELREAIAEHYAARYGVWVHLDQICVTAGSSPAFLLSFAVLLNLVDEVILSDPHTPCYPNFIDLLGGKKVFVRVREEDRFQFRPEAVKKKLSRRNKAILVNSPSNPTGYLVPPETFEALSQFRPYLISDEIYHGLTYEGRERSVL